MQHLVVDASRVNPKQREREEPHLHQHHHTTGNFLYDKPTISPVRKKTSLNVQTGPIGQIAAKDTIFSNLDHSIKLSCDMLLSIQLNNAGIKSAHIFVLCKYLKELDLADNKLSEVPDLSSLHQCQFMNFSSNYITALGHIGLLFNPPSGLICANFKNNPVCHLPSYRHYILSHLSALLVLDDSLVLVIERHTRASWYTQGQGMATGRPSLATRWGMLSIAPPIDPMFTVAWLSEDQQLLARRISLRVRCLRRIQQAVDPVVKIQLVWRSRLYNHYIRRFETQVVYLQAAIRGRRHRLEVDKALEMLLRTHDIENPESPKLAREGEREKLLGYDEASKFYAIVISKAIRKYTFLQKRSKAACLIQVAFKTFMLHFRRFKDQVAASSTSSYLVAVEDIDRLLACCNAVKERMKRFSHVSVHSGTCPYVYKKELSTRNGLGRFVWRATRERVRGCTSFEDVSMTARLRRFASPAEKRQLDRLLRRAVTVPRANKEDYLWLMAARPPTVLQPVLELHISSIALMFYTRIRMSVLYPHLYLMLPLTLARYLGAQQLQRLWRGRAIRKRVYQQLLCRLLQRRSSVLLQRWYRFHSTVGRRLRLLNSITQMCCDIDTPYFYLDAKSFYSLVKHAAFSPLTRGVRYFPEFRGVPGVLPDSARVVFCAFSEFHLKSEKTHESFLFDDDLPVSCDFAAALLDLSSSKTSPWLSKRTRPLAGTKRVGCPKWCSWSPPVSDTPSADRGRQDASHKFLSLLLSHSDLRLEAVALAAPGGAQDTLTIRLVRVGFDTVREAQRRAAMLVLATFDPTTKCSVLPLSQRSLAIKVKTLSRSLSDVSRADDIYPLEANVMLTPLDARYYLHKLSFDMSDLIRFRYMLEATLPPVEPSVAMPTNMCDISKLLLLIHHKQPLLSILRPHVLDRTEEALVSKLSLLQTQFYRPDVPDRSVNSPRPLDKIKLLQHDGQVTHIPDEHLVDPCAYFDSTTARSRVLTTKAHSAKVFRGHNRQLLDEAEAERGEYLRSIRQQVQEEKLQQKRERYEQLCLSAVSVDAAVESPQNKSGASVMPAVANTNISHPLKPVQPLSSNSPTKLATQVPTSTEHEKEKEKKKEERGRKPEQEKVRLIYEKTKRSKRRMKENKAFTHAFLQNIGSYIKKTTEANRHQLEGLARQQQYEKVQQAKLERRHVGGYTYLARCRSPPRDGEEGDRMDEKEAATAALMNWDSLDLSSVAQDQQPSSIHKMVARPPSANSRSSFAHFPFTFSRHHEPVSNPHSVSPSRDVRMEDSTTFHGLSPDRASFHHSLHFPVLSVMQSMQTSTSTSVDLV